MAVWCRRLVLAFGVLYVLALALFAIGTFGLFGSPSGPLAGVFLVPLGLPWVMLLDAVPGPLRPVLAPLAPLVNLGLAALACRALRGRSRRA